VAACVAINRKYSQQISMMEASTRKREHAIMASAAPSALKKLAALMKPCAVIAFRAVETRRFLAIASTLTAHPPPRSR
jgi:hypothetical protein